MRALVIALLLLVGCDFGYDKAPQPPENLGSRFILEDKAQIGGYYLFVIRDKKNNNLIYMSPQSGLWIQKPSVEELPVPPIEGSHG